MEPVAISRTLVQRVLGGLLLLSGMLYLLLTVVQMPKLKQSNDLFFSYDTDGWAFFGSLAASCLFIFSRLALGYVVYLAKPVAHWLFCSLCLLTLFSGGIGLILAIAALLLRYWPDKDDIL